jgi:hypothetical protein
MSVKGCFPILGAVADFFRRDDMTRLWTTGVSLAVLVIFGGASTFAQTATGGSTLKIAPGTSAQISGNRVTLRSTQGTTGSFDCSCKNGVGGCNLQTTGDYILCYKDKAKGGTCSGVCELIVTTNPSLGGPAAAGASPRSGAQ